MAVTVSESIIIRPRRQNTYQIIVTYPSNFTSVSTPNLSFLYGSGWLSISTVSISSNEYTYRITLNEYATELHDARVCNIIFSANTPTGIESGYVTVFQAYKYNSIWVDNYFTARRSYNMSYTLSDEEDKLLYKGSAAPLPNGTIELNIPRIVDNMFEHPTIEYDSDGAWYDTHLARPVAFRESGTAFPSDVFPLMYNWSYSSDDYKYDRDVVLNMPVNGRITPWMTQTFSVYNDSNSNYYAVAYNGQSVVSRYDFGAPEYQTAEVILYFDDSIATADRIVIYKNDNNHPVANYTITDCGEYALTYLNKRGGHDTLLIEGNTRVIDEYERDQFTQNAYNREPTAFAKTTIQNRITTVYELTTGWLTDEQSEIVASQLLPSPQVFISNNFYIPYAANIRDTSVEHKRFKNGKQLNRYTITVEASKTKSFK